VTARRAACLLLASQGPSGSGKTTLLDLMAGRKTSGKMRGEILFAGNRATRPFLRRFTGYVSGQPRARARGWGAGGRPGAAAAAAAPRRLARRSRAWVVGGAACSGCLAAQHTVSRPWFVLAPRNARRWSSLTRCCRASLWRRC
jgi:hypothetical protein